MAEHTPGPWRIEEQDGEVLIVSAKGAEPGYPRESFLVATSAFETSPRGQANARLIAAAPEMYDELWRLADRLRRDVPAHTCPGFDCATCARPDAASVLALLDKIDKETPHA